MVIDAGFACGFRRLSSVLRALLPLPGSACQYQRAVGLVALGICFGVISDPTHAQTPIRIGASLGLTGVYAEFGPVSYTHLTLPTIYSV